MNKETSCQGERREQMRKMQTKMEQKKPLGKRLRANRARLLMFLPGFAFILLFSYGPMYGLVLAFKDFNIGLGIWDSPWVGWKHFRAFLSNASSLRVLGNTLRISLLHLVFGFPAPIILALLLNELKPGFFKRAAQTISYLPHFISWIVVAGILSNLLSPGTGMVNEVIKMLGGKPVYFLADVRWFRTVLVVSNIWKGIGWGSVVYLAALCSIPPEQYESAMIDGANRLQRIRYITLPSMKGIISIMLLMQAGSLMNAGFDQVFNLYNPSVYAVGDIIDTYVYRMGIGQMMYSFNTAVGLFKSTVNFILVMTVNFVTKRINEGESVLF